MRYISTLFTLTLTLSTLSATTPWTLEQCILYAQQHNLQIERQEQQIELQKIALENQKNRQLPDLNGGASQSFGFGRALTYNNTYANRNTQSTSFSLSSGIPIFSGFEIINSQKQAGINLEASIKDLEGLRNNISLQIASAYLNVLYNNTMAEVAEREEEKQALLVEQIRAYYLNGKRSASDLQESLSSYEQSKLSSVRAQNNLQMAQLELTQLLDLDTPDNFSVVPIEIDSSIVSFQTPDEIFQLAISHMPQIDAEQLRLQSQELGVKIAKSGLYPRLSLSAGIGSSYYQTSGYNQEKFTKQIGDNFTQNINLMLSIPIFNRMQTRNSVRSAHLQHNLQIIQIEESKKQLYKEIQQAYYNARGSETQCSSSKAAYLAAEKAYQLMEEKYLNGKAVNTQLLTQRTEYLRAYSEWVQSQYELMLRSMILRYYSEGRLL